MDEQECVIQDPRTRVRLNKAERDLLKPEQRSALDRVNEGEVDAFHFGEKCGRIYHPFQQLPGWVREKVEIEGEPAVELDLKTSQALVLFRVVAEDLWKGSGRLSKDVKKGLEGDHLRARAIPHERVHAGRG